jgi:hypothetical protein
MFKSAYPVLEGVDSGLHFPVLSMNRLDQTEPVSFLILPFLTYLGILFLSTALPSPPSSTGFSKIQHFINGNGDRNIRRCVHTAVFKPLAPHRCPPPPVKLQCRNMTFTVSG